MLVFNSKPPSEAAPAPVIKIKDGGPQINKRMSKKYKWWKFLFSLHKIGLPLDLFVLSFKKVDGEQDLSRFDAAPSAVEMEEDMIHSSTETWHTESSLFCGRYKVQQRKVKHLSCGIRHLYCCDIKHVIFAAYSPPPRVPDENKEHLQFKFTRR